MNNVTARHQAIFFEVFESLPRQGPGNRACTARALQLCGELPASPVVLDLGCGTGAQTLHLAELTNGSIVALDNHAPSIERLRAIIAERGLDGRIRAEIGDMANPDLPPGSFDLAWSEGAFYNIGIDRALQLCRTLLRPGGCLAFTDAVWLTADPPPEVKEVFDAEYPGMGTAAAVIDSITRAGFSPAGHFTLPDEAWWDDFYTPMLRRIDELERAHTGDAEAIAVLADLRREPEMHRRYSYSYGYEFFVARLP